MSLGGCRWTTTTVVVVTADSDNETEPRERCCRGVTLILTLVWIYAFPLLFLLFGYNIPHFFFLFMYANYRRLARCVFFFFFFSFWFHFLVTFPHATPSVVARTYHVNFSSFFFLFYNIRPQYLLLKLSHNEYFFCYLL